MTFNWRLFAFLIAIGGGILGILGAIIQEWSQGSLLVAFAAVPMIEEVMISIRNRSSVNSISGITYKPLF